MSDPNLNESGRVNMGDVSKLKENHPTLFTGTGQKAPSSAPSVEELQKALADQAVSWHRDDTASKEAGKDMWFPRLSIPNLSEKFGVSRPHKDFYAEERNMFIQAFMNDCAAYLFGVEAFREIQTKDGVAFRPNPEWVRLAVHKS